MAVRIPQVLIAAQVFVDGEGFLGTIDLTLPNITKKKVTQSSGVGDYDIGLPTLEKIETTATVREYSKTVFGLLSEGKTIIVKKAYKQGSTTVAVEATFKGSFDLEDSDQTPGKNAELKLKIAASYYRLEVANEEWIEVDHVNHILKIDGTDMLAEVNEIIS